MATVSTIQRNTLSIVRTDVPSVPSSGGSSREREDGQTSGKDGPERPDRRDSSSPQRTQLSCQRHSKDRSTPGHLHYYMYGLMHDHIYQVFFFERYYSAL